MQRIFPIRHPYVSLLGALVALLSLPILVGALSNFEGEQATISEIEISLELGEDLGQPLGTLFEIRQGSSLVGGAGFAQNYGTFSPHTARVLSFYVSDGDSAVHIKPIGRPFAYSSQVFNVNGDLIAVSQPDEDDLPKRYDPKTGEWLVWRESPLSGVQEVAERLLIYEPHRASYDDVILYEDMQSFLSFLYRAGELFIYRHDPPHAPRICNWRPGGALRDCKAFEVPDTFGFPYALHWRDGEFFAATNQGYVFSVSRENGVTTLFSRLQPGSKSWQGYAFHDWFDDILLGMYPNGNLYSLRHEDFLNLNVPRGASSLGREAQSMAIYNGLLFVGLWPWSEIHGLSEWGGQFIGRLIEQPAHSDGTRAPYGDRGKAEKGRRFNAWGQRVTALVPWRDSLIASTSNKSGSAAYSDLIPNAEDYGKVFKITTGRNLACPIEWRPNTRLRFTILPDRLDVAQDGDEICSHSLGARVFGEVSLAQGLWGKFGGHQISITDLH